MISGSNDDVCDGTDVARTDEHTSLFWFNCFLLQEAAVV